MTVSVTTTPEHSTLRRLTPPRPGRGGRLTGLVTHPAVLSWVVARIAIFGALGMARFLVSDLEAHSASGRPPSGLLGWDANWYLRIIKTGYNHLPWEARRFFPLLPLMAKPLTLFTTPRVGVLVIVNVCALAAGFFIDRLIRQEGGDRAAGGRAAWYLALLPPAFVLAMGYAEAVMIAAAMGAFLALRRKRWWWAAMAGALVGISRPLGIVMVVPSVIEAARGIRRTGATERLARVVAAASAPLGAAIYLLWVGLRFGDPLFPFKVQEEIGRRGHFVSPVGRLMAAAKELIHSNAFGSGLHFPWGIAFIALLLVAARRLPVSYTLYGAVIVVIALSASNLDSLERYGLSAFPIVMALALITDRGWLDRVVLVLCASGLVAYTTLAFLGAYVP